MVTPNLSSTPAAAVPWWRVGMVWLVIAGPVAVIVAAVATAVVAVRGAEPVLSAEEAGRFADRPAVQGRNHAATDAQRR